MTDSEVFFRGGAKIGLFFLGIFGRIAISPHRVTVSLPGTTCTIDRKYVSSVSDYWRPFSRGVQIHHTDKNVPDTVVFLGSRRRLKPVKAALEAMGYPVSWLTLGSSSKHE